MFLKIALKPFPNYRINYVYLLLLTYYSDVGYTFPMKHARMMKSLRELFLSCFKRALTNHLLRENSRYNFVFGADYLSERRAFGVIKPENLFTWHLENSRVFFPTRKTNSQWIGQAVIFQQSANVMETAKCWNLN